MSGAPVPPKPLARLIDCFVAADFGAGGAASRAALNDVIDDDPAALQAYEELEILWDRLGDLEAPDVGALAPPRRLRRAAYHWWRDAASSIASRAVAAVVVAALCTIALLAVLRDDAGRPGPAYVLETAKAERRIARLADGSSIELSAESRIAVQYSGNERRIRLERGQALFDVAHNPRRPFIVAAAVGEVRALGTTFNVRLDDGDVVVTVVEGTVQVAARTPEESRAGGPTASLIEIASRGEQVTYGVRTVDRGEEGATFISSARPVDVASSISWTQGLLEFHGESLADVVEEVNRHSTERIVLLDPTVANLKIYGVLRAGDPQGLVSIIRDREKLDQDALARTLRVVPAAD